MSQLFSPLTIRGQTTRNRIVISPMCMYSAKDGVAQPFHRTHLAQFAMGGAGIVFAEATAVVPEGRITHGDLGLWSDQQAEALAPVAAAIRAHGAVPAIQIGHAGRKASMQRPWEGNGALGPAEFAKDEHPWTIHAPSALPFDEGWLVPEALDAAGIRRIMDGFAAAARRAVDAGFGIIEVHAAHGYLLSSFLSPLTNLRDDAYGGSFDNRCRAVLDAVEAVRGAVPDDIAVFLRVSSVENMPGGWDIDDSVALARKLKPLGVDVIDCSSGGNSPLAAATAGSGPRGPGFQVPFADRIRREAQIMTQAVGLILDGPQAEQVLADGAADLVAIAREALADPWWPLHQARAMGVDTEFSGYPEQYGWWLVRRERALAKMRAAE